jgi:hypothetical protein
MLEYHLGGRDISEVLAMSVTEAEEFFGAGEARTPAAHAILDRLANVGLGCLSLGQPLTTLSGGERQRLKLATHIGERGGVYVLTSRPPASTSPTSSSCSACSTGSSTQLERLVDLTEFGTCRLLTGGDHTLRPHRQGTGQLYPSGTSAGDPP